MYMNPKQNVALGFPYFLLTALRPIKLCPSAWRTLTAVRQ